MAKPRFTMVVLLVEDLARSLAFYRRLGIEFPEGADKRRDVGVDIGDGRTIIWTTTFGDNDPSRTPPSGGSRIMLDSTFAELEAAGYHVVREPFVTSFEAYMCLVDDPDGNTVLVTAG